VKFRLSGKYGELSEVRNNQPHNGIDIAMPEGTELRSVVDGVVERVFDGSGKIGEGVVIKLEDGTRAIYGHMSDVDVKVGERIEAGELIGLSGNTGNSTGPHLHFGIMRDGQFVDPSPLAEPLANMSGNVGESWLDGMVNDHGGILTKYLYKKTEGVREEAAEKTYDFVMGVLDALGTLIYDLSGAIALVGGGLCIVLWVAGWKDGMRWTGILFAANTLIRYLFGGAAS
jgi:murein DD-endopeptidase MepM/ murein hydrolase activator NlpD